MQELKELNILMPVYLKKFFLKHLEKTSQGHLLYCGKKIVVSSYHVPPRRFENKIATKFIVDKPIKENELAQHLFSEFDKYFHLWIFFKKNTLNLPNNPKEKNIQLVSQFMQEYDITEDDISVDYFLRKWQRVKHKKFNELYPI